MPIRPENRARYPKDWKAISQRVRDRAGQKCEFCGIPNYELGAWIGGRWHRAIPKGSGLRDNPRHGEVFPCVYGESEVWRKLVRVVLTVAHLDHQPENCADDNLKALCQRCHNIYDMPMRRAGIARRAREAAGIQDMFEAQV